MAVEVRYPTGTIISVTILAADMPNELVSRGRNVQVFDEMDRQWFWNGTAYALPQGGGTGTFQNSLSPGSTVVGPTVTAVNTGLALKANTSDLTGLASTASLVSGLANKYDKSVVDTLLGSKANASDLAAKANTSDVTTLLSGKADTSALAGLAVASDVQGQLDTKAVASDVAAQLDGKSNVGHNHAVTSIVGLDAYSDNRIDTRLAFWNLLGGASAPPPPAPTPPAPAPGSGTGTGSTETVKPVYLPESGPNGIGNAVDGQYVVNPGFWQGGTAAVDDFTFTPRINGTKLGAARAQKYFVDDSAANILLAKTFTPLDSERGSVLSFEIAAHNDAGTTLAYTDGIVISATATGGTGGGGGGGEAPAGGTGALTFVSRSLPLSFNITTLGTQGWAISPTTTGAVSKASPARAITVTDIGTQSNDATNIGLTITYSDGTPTTSGTSSTGTKTNFSATAVGKRYVIDANTTLCTFHWIGSIYSCMVTFACTLSDGSATSISVGAPSNSNLALDTPADITANTGYNRHVQISFKAGSAGKTVQIDATVTDIGGSGGDCHFMGVYLT